MMPLEPIASTALAAAVLLLLSLLALRWRQRQGSRRPAPPRDALDTVQAWPPASARVMSIHERQSYELLRRAFPGFLVLAQVPLSRFLRVPTLHPHGEWMQRVGSHSADLLLCDAGSRVLAVIDIRAADETARSRNRHERLARVLKAAGIRVHVWREGALPTLAGVRSTLGAELAAGPAPTKPTSSRPMPLIPVPDIEELLAHGDRQSYDTDMEPVPSAFFEDVEPVSRQLKRA